VLVPGIIPYKSLVGFLGKIKIILAQIETSDSVTVGQLLDALKTNIFSEIPTDEFEKKCRQREKLIKQYLDTCGIIAHQHIEKPGLDFNTLSFWKKDRCKTCLKNISDYITELVLELNKEKIESYCKKVTPFSFRPVFDADLTLLTLNSYYGSVVADVYWISDLTVHEAMKIAGGKLTLESLGDRTPNRISQIKKDLEENKNKLVHYKDHIDTIHEAFECFQKKFYKAFNLLLLTSIEGLVRKLGIFLIEKQNLSADPFDNSYNSLDSFLRKIPWKEELKISRTQLALLTSNYTRINYNDPLAPRVDPLQKVNVSIKTRLDFLRRRFKENRDLILHGQETEYNKPFHGYINASALEEVIQAILECQDVYK
jgi:hypothetical protein